MKREYKVGIVGIIALVTLFLGINFLKGKTLLNINKEYYVSFSNAKGLAKSSMVFADGYEVGIVSDVIYNYAKPGNVLIEISVDPKLVLCEGTKIRLDAGLMGGVTMNIYPARISDKIYQHGDTIPGDDKSGLMGKAEDMMPSVLKVVNKLDTLIASVNRLMNDSTLPAILGNVEQVTSDLTQTTKHLNALMAKDIPALAQTYSKVGENVQAITENLKGIDIQATLDSVNMTISNVNTVVAQLQNTQGSVGALLYDRSLFDGINRTIGSVDSLMTDIKARPKRYVHFSLFGRKNN